ncbi:MAG: FeS-binding protein [Candidatus Heimdallarchaeota archaeon]|nr:MAG: FeS-binding protein [Candidatus Heimdallarchaeota archaeon]
MIIHAPLDTEILSPLEKKGCQGRIVSIRHLKELRHEINGLHRQKLLNENLYREREFSSFDYEHTVFPEATSIIIVAYPDPPYNVTFNWYDKDISVRVPPTYLLGQSNDKRIKTFLLQSLKPLGYRVAKANIPLKLLAVRSGLARYGKNNIGYIRGMGSFCRLVAFFSDYVCERDEWFEPRKLERCENCTICFQKCPTNAITEKRFLIHAERCLTYLNEQPGHVQFPNWVSHAAHNCLVGCLRCQMKCPENRKIKNWIKQGPKFSFKETGLLLARTPIEHLPVSTVDKLKNFGIDYLIDLIPRNLQTLIKRIDNHKLD